MRCFIRLICVPLIIAIILSGCDHEVWKRVSVTDVGIFEVPVEWLITQEENVVYFTDKPRNEEHHIYMAGIIYSPNTAYRQPYELFEGIKRSNDLHGTNYSNSAGYFVNEYEMFGQIESRYSITFFSYPSPLEIFVLDATISEATVKKITLSFEME